jgi:hypothetical protein
LEAGVPASVLSVITSAARRSNLPIPTSLVTTPKDFEYQYLENFYQLCEDLLSRGAWACLKKTHTFTTTTDTEYALPSDFWTFCAGTQWDRTNYWPLTGPITDKAFNEEKYWFGPSSTKTSFRIFGSKDATPKKPLVIEPAETGLSLGFDYISSQYIADATGATRKDTITVDTDICLFPEVVLKAGFRFFWLAKKGQDTMQAEALYERLIARTMFKDVGPVISSRSPHPEESIVFNTDEGDWSV